MNTPTIDEQIECVKREITMRQRVYPRWVQQRRLSQEQMNRELARMQAVLQTLQNVKHGTVPA